MKELFDLIPENYFVKDLRTNSLGSIKIALLREATGNLIIRNNYPDETTTFRVSDKKDAVEIPARKLKSKEKLLGLKICRDMGAPCAPRAFHPHKRSGMGTLSNCKGGAISKTCTFQYPNGENCTLILPGGFWLCSM